MRIAVFLGLVLIAGCSKVTTYQPPDNESRPFIYELTGSKEQIFEAAKITLEEQGYKISQENIKTGFITTGRVPQELNSRDCDCGSSGGDSYAGHYGTTTDVSIHMSAFNNGIMIKAYITAEHVSDDHSEVKTFPCVSLGTVEEALSEVVKEVLDRGAEE